jgi:hypothetical protein
MSEVKPALNALVGLKADLLEGETPMERACDLVRSLQ